MLIQQRPGGEMELASVIEDGACTRGWRQFPAATLLSKAGNALNAIAPGRRDLLPATVGRTLASAALASAILLSGSLPGGAAVSAVELEPGPVPRSTQFHATSPASNPGSGLQAVANSGLQGTVRNPAEAALWAQSADPAKKLAVVPAGGKLKLMGEQENNRVFAYFEDPSPKGQKLAGWVNQSDLAQATPVNRAEPSSRGGARQGAGSQSPEQFIASVIPAAQLSERETKVPSSVTIAQAILESEWGRSELSREANNYFGIKAGGAPGPAGVFKIDTTEFVGGQQVTVTAGFKAYNSLDESILDHGRFLSGNPRYAQAFKTSDPSEFATRIHEAGYATDPGYCGKVSSLIQRYGLDRYDLKPAG